MPRQAVKRPSGDGRASRGQSTAAADTTWWRSPWIECGLVALGLLVYAQSRHFQFVNWDDPEYVTANHAVQAGLSWHGVRWAFASVTSPYWQPLTWLSHMVDVTLFGVVPGPPHLVNVGLHLASTLLLFWTLRRMTGAAGPSAVVAAIFAVHPVHAESVAWVAERKDVLSSALLLVSLWMYLRYVARRSWPRYAALAGTFALALMAKPMVVTFPLLLLLLDHWPLGRLRPAAPAGVSWRTAILEKLPLAAMAATVGGVTIWVQAVVGAMPDLNVAPPGARAARALVEYVVYVGEVIWPVGLAAFYPMRRIAPSTAATAAGALVAITWAAIHWRRTRPYLFVGWIWYLLMLAPVIGVLQAGEQSRADRFLYLPMVGLLVAIVWAASDLFARLGARSVVPALASAAVVALLTSVGIVQTATWQDSLTLWRHAAAVTADNYKAYEKLGQAERDLAEYSAATADYQHALAVALPDSPRYEAAIHNDLGLVLAGEKQPMAAVAEFETALREDPSFAAADINLANALATTGQLADAADRFTAAIRTDPESAEARVGLGNVLLQEGRPADAIGSFTEALRLEDDLADAHNGLGAALLETGQPGNAAAEFTEAIRLRPTFPTAELNLALALARTGQPAEARQHVEAALALAPNLPGAHELLASLQDVKRR
jgi:Tfp pilus assembly protein PilF